jgi:hypothetical protein
MQISVFCSYTFLPWCVRSLCYALCFYLSQKLTGSFRATQRTFEANSNIPSSGGGGKSAASLGKAGLGSKLQAFLTSKADFRLPFLHLVFRDHNLIQIVNKKNLAQYHHLQPENMKY